MSRYEPLEQPFSVAPPSEADKVLDRTLKVYTDKEIILERLLSCNTI